MFSNLGLYVILNPAGTYSYVGNLPRVLGVEADPTKSDVMGGRCYTKAPGVYKVTKFPTFPTAEAAIKHAADCGFICKAS